MSLQNYADAIGNNRSRPTDQFSHASFLVEVERTPVAQFSQLVQKEVMLANLSDDSHIRLYQNDGNILTGIFSFTKIEPCLSELFYYLYYSWQMELALTRAKDANERKLQAATKQYHPPDLSQGYGSDFAQQQQIDYESDENIVRGLKEKIASLRRRR